MKTSNYKGIRKDFLEMVNDFTFHLSDDFSVMYRIVKGTYVFSIVRTDTYLSDCHFYDSLGLRELYRFNANKHGFPSLDMLRKLLSCNERQLNLF